MAEKGKGTQEKAPVNPLDQDRNAANAVVERDRQKRRERGLEVEPSAQDQLNISHRNQIGRRG